MRRRRSVKACVGRALRPLLVAAAASCGADDPVAPPVPSPPESLTAVALGVDRIELQWNHAGVETTHFLLEERDPGDAAFGSIGEVSTELRRHVITGLVAGQRYEYRLRACDGDDCSDPSSTAAATTSELNPDRAEADRPDDISGSQVHVMYVIPADGEDRRLDADGTLATSIASLHGWFQVQSGLRLRFDTHDGALDIVFHRLGRTDAQLKAFGALLVTEIERELDEAGVLREDKVYLVYFDGGSNYSCGGAAWPPTIQGRVAALYLEGTPPGASCGSQGFAKEPSAFPGYWEFAALHDLVHTFGIVAESAPHHAAAYPAHVPEPADLMYSGPDPWIIDATTVIDVDGDDYFGSDVPTGVMRLTASPFVEPVPATAAARLLKPLPRAVPTLADEIVRLPVHPPFPGAGNP